MLGWGMHAAAVLVPSPSYGTFFLKRLKLDTTILVVNSKGRGWTLPGGKPEPQDRMPQVTATRELREETGLEVEFSMMNEIYAAPDLRYEDRLIHVFLASQARGTLVAEPNSSVTWVSVRTLLDKPFGSPFVSFYTRMFFALGLLEVAVA